jgi:myo-inositol-1(or 4)-monophosphatase
VSDKDLLDVLSAAAAAVRSALDRVADWRPTTGRPGQYVIDVVADEVAVELLLAAGLGVLSEESGAHHLDRDTVVVLDPVDGSTNASRGIPWYATSLCAVDGDGPRAALVVDQSSGERFQAVRGGGARRGPHPVVPSGCTDLGAAIVGFAGRPPRAGRWGQFRALGAAALDLCGVACGRLDGYVDSSPAGHSPWDYLGALLVCREAGVEVADAEGRELVVLDATARRRPVAAATSALLGELLSLGRKRDDGE